VQRCETQHELVTVIEALHDRSPNPREGWSDSDSQVRQRPRHGRAAVWLRLASRTQPLVLSFFLCACSGHEGEATAIAATRDTSNPYDQEKVVNVYSWADYIAPDTISNFEKETGIKVQYDVYDNNEILETKLLSGHSNYDVVVPTDVFFDRQREAGVYRELDKRALPNLANVDPEIMRRMAVHDPGNLHAIPYMWSTTGLGYNIDMVRKRLGGTVPDSWALLFNPQNAARLQDCGILIVDSPLDVFDSAIIYLHRDPRRRDPKDVLAAAELLHAIRPFVRNIDPAPIAPLASGEVCLELAWSGDVEAARNRAIENSTGAHRLPDTARRRADDDRHGRDSRGCTPSSQRRNLAELPLAPRRHCRHQQLHQVSER